MCRLAYLNNRAIEALDTEEIAKFFRLLELSQGGHGNGVGGVVDGKFIVVKGVGKSVEELARIVKDVQWDNGVIFHTRLASTGTVSDELCHPFVSLDGAILLAHNGHFSDYSTMLRLLKMIDDRYERFCVASVRYVFDKDLYEYRAELVKESDDCAVVSDTWVATELLSFLTRYHGDVERAVLMFHRQYSDTGNYFVMTRDATVYLVIGSGDFEIYADRGVVVAASEAIDMLSVVKRKKIMTAVDTVIRVEKSGNIEVVSGSLEKKRRRKRLESWLERIESYIWRERWW